jgi:virginiamycin B lyase
MILRHASVRVAGNRPRAALATALALAALAALSAAAPALAETLPPENTALPAITPSEPEEGVFVKASTGTWTHSPTGYKYQWQRCNPVGGSCANIENPWEPFEPNAYKPVASDAGHMLRVQVTAKNSAGQASAVSEATHPVLPPLVVTEYGKPEKPAGSIAAGADGNLWFTEPGAPGVGKITTSGTMTHVASWSGFEEVFNIAAGAPGESAVWFVGLMPDTIGRLTTEGSFTDYGLPSVSVGLPSHIAGWQGSAWVSEPWIGKVAQITPSGTITQRALASSSAPSGVAHAPGGIFVTEPGLNRIAVLNLTETKECQLPEGSEPKAITSGPAGDSRAWFIDVGTHKIGRINLSCEVTEYPLPEGIVPSQIVAGADGRLWFNDAGFKYVGAITTAGTVTVQYVASLSASPVSLAAGPDAYVWFVTSTGTIGKFTV